MPLTNPYPSGTDNHVDFEIWNNGVERFNDPARKYSRHTGQPHELDYLRGFHDPGTLAAIKARIAAVTGQTVNVTSFWLDKTAYVSPTTPGVSTKKRELADLAIVLRDYARRDHVMWILQAKKGDNAATRLATGGSTSKEIELFEKAPQFELEPLSKAKTNLAFNLEPEFGPPANSVNFRHWSFLMFRETPTTPAASGPSPAQWRWNGSGQNPQTGSFMKGITEMLLSPMDPDHKGAKLLPGMPTGWKPSRCADEPRTVRRFLGTCWKAHAHHCFLHSGTASLADWYMAHECGFLAPLPVCRFQRWRRAPLAASYQIRHDFHWP